MKKILGEFFGGAIRYTAGALVGIVMFTEFFRVPNMYKKNEPRSIYAQFIDVADLNRNHIMDEGEWAKVWEVLNAHGIYHKDKNIPRINEEEVRSYLEILRREKKGLEKTVGN